MQLIKLIQAVANAFLGLRGQVCYDANMHSPHLYNFACNLHKRNCRISLGNGVTISLQMITRIQNKIANQEK